MLPMTHFKSKDTHRLAVKDYIEHSFLGKNLKWSRYMYLYHWERKRNKVVHKYNK